MDRDAFLKLPPALALRVLFDCLDEETVRAIGNVEAPKEPRCPRFDRTIFRQGGVNYASECSLEGLRFWHKRSVESAASGGQYADKDRKNAEELARWIAWREWYPDAVWSGERNNQQVTAKPPTQKPTVYPRQGNGNRPAPPPQEDTVDPDTW